MIERVTIPAQARERRELRNRTAWRNWSSAGQRYVAHSRTISTLHVRASVRELDDCRRRDLVLQTKTNCGAVLDTEVVIDTVAADRADSS